MSNRLGGKQGTAYVGTNAVQPPDYTFSDRDPNQYDINNVTLGDFWLNTDNENLWVLVSLEGIAGSKGSLATWSKLETGGSVTGPLDTLTGTTGGAVPPDGSSNINLVSGIFGLSFDGNPLTNTITLNSSATDNIVETITGNNGGPVPALLGNINIVGDNVGITIVGNPGTNTLTASLIGGEDAAGTFPTDSGTASSSGGVLNINAGNSTQNSGASVLFTGTGNTVELKVTDGNANTIIGESSGNATISGFTNTILGVACGGSLTSGSANTFVGYNVTEELTTGSQNTLIGYLAGDNYTSSESSNVLIQSDGVNAESNVLRIGRGTGVSVGFLNQSFIQGIRGITPATADGIPVFVGSTGQLGTVGNGGISLISTATGNSGGAVGPLAGNINIVGDGATANVIGNPGTNTLTITAIGGGGGTLNDLVGDDSIPVVPLAGIINVIADVSTQHCGSSVEFSGAIANTLLLNVTDSNDNTIIGFGSGNATIVGTNNTVLGDTCASALTSGASNTIVGQNAGAGITTGSTNILLGASAGSSFTTSESNNILIGSTGTITQSNSLRIGTGTGGGAGQLNKSFIHGIVGITPATADGVPVFIGSAGQLGTVGNGGTTFVSTLTANSGGAVSPLAGNINIVGDGVSANVVGSPGTNTLTISAIGGGGGGASDFVTDNGTAIEAGGVISIIAGNISQNCGSTVEFNGSGNTVELSVTDSDDNTIIGFGSGNATLTGTKNTALGNECISALTSGSSNIFLGNLSGSLVTTGTGNFLCGDASLNVVLKGTTTSTGLYAFGASTGTLFLHNWGGATSGNTFVGYGSGSSFNAGQQATNKFNTACGRNTLALLTTGANNTTLGNASGTNITTGSFNALMGSSAGINYTSSESNNILINAPGTVAESNILRIGNGNGSGTQQLNKSFISGIRGITTTNANAIPVVIDSAGQLGTAGGVSFVNTLTGDTGGPVSASAGNININAGAGITVVGNPGLNKLTISATGGGGGSSAGNPSFMTYLTNPTTVPFNTNVQIIYDTLAFNLGGAFNLGTSTFTAPTTGLYNFSCSVSYSNAGVGTFNPGRGYIILDTTSSDYIISVAQYSNLKLAPSDGPQSVFIALGNSTYVRMIAGDTAMIFTYLSGGTGAQYVLAGSSSLVTPGIGTSFGCSFISA